MIRTCFVDARGQVGIVCKKKHKSAKCRRPHQIPKDVLWSGEVDKAVHGELIEAAREQRKEYRKASAKWTRRYYRLKRKTPAPAFAAFLKNELDKHEAARPPRTFSIDAGRLEAVTQ